MPLFLLLFQDIFLYPPVLLSYVNDHGYQGYIYKNRETNEYYLVHEGSAVPGFNSETAKVRRLGFNPTSFLIINYQ